MRKQLTILTASLTLLGATDAMAYGYRTCNGEKINWDNNNITMKASPISFPTGYWRNALQRAVDIFYMNPSNFWFTLGTDNNTWSYGNGSNEIFGTDNASVHGGAPAAAVTQRTCYWLFGTHTWISESDIYFNYSAPWRWTGDETQSSLWTYNSNGAGLRQLQATAIHELGHSAGLSHENRWYNMMGTDFTHLWANGSTAHGYPGEDLSNALVFMYGLWNSPYEDTHVSHWKYSGTSGEYSAHERTVVYNTSGGMLPVTTVNNERGHVVNRGQQVRVEFTYENSGKTTQTVPLRYVLSSNRTISTADTTLGSGSVTLGRNTPYTTTGTVTIPSNTVPGNYWIGVIADPNSTISDNQRYNNATYIPVRVQ